MGTRRLITRIQLIRNEYLYRPLLIVSSLLLVVLITLALYIRFDRTALEEQINSLSVNNEQIINNRNEKITHLRTKISDAEKGTDTLKNKIVEKNQIISDPKKGIDALKNKIVEQNQIISDTEKGIAALQKENGNQMEMLERQEKQIDEIITIFKRLSPENVLLYKAIQTFLSKQGYYEEEIDGKWGKGTCEAIQKFQKKAGSSKGTIIKKCLDDKPIGISSGTHGFGESIPPSEIEIEIVSVDFLKAITSEL